MYKRFRINPETWLKYFSDKPAYVIAKELGVSQALISKALKVGLATEKLAKKLYKLNKEFLTTTIIKTQARNTFIKDARVIEKPFSEEDLNIKEEG